MGHHSPLPCGIGHHSHVSCGIWAATVLCPVAWATTVMCSVAWAPQSCVLWHGPHSPVSCGMGHHSPMSCGMGRQSCVPGHVARLPPEEVRRGEAIAPRESGTRKMFLLLSLGGRRLARSLADLFYHRTRERPTFSASTVAARCHICRICS